MNSTQILQNLPLGGVRQIYQAHYRRHMQGDRV